MWFVCATKGLFCDLFPHYATDRSISLVATTELLFFPQQNYVTDIMLCNSYTHRNKFSCLDGYAPTHQHVCTCTHACAHTDTYLVLLQGSLLLHVRTVFASDNSFDISHRHCKEDRSKLSMMTTTTTTTSL